MREKKYTGVLPAKFAMVVLAFVVVLWPFWFIAANNAELHLPEEFLKIVKGDWAEPVVTVYAAKAKPNLGPTIVAAVITALIYIASLPTTLHVECGGLPQEQFLKERRSKRFLRLTSLAFFAAFFVFFVYVISDGGGSRSLEEKIRKRRPQTINPVTVVVKHLRGGDKEWIRSELGRYVPPEGAPYAPYVIMQVIENGEGFAIEENDVFYKTHCPTLMSMDKPLPSMKEGVLNSLKDSCYVFLTEVAGGDWASSKMNDEARLLVKR